MSGFSAELVDCDGLRESLAEVCASQEEFSRFFSGVFAGLEMLSAELIERQRAWQAERAQTEGALAQQAARLEAQRAAIAAEREEAWKEVERRHLQLQQEHLQAGLSAAGGNASGNGQLEQMLEEAERERAALSRALEAAQAQSDRLAQVAEELAQTRNELASAREEIQRLREGLKEGPANACPPQSDANLHEQIQRMEKERAELEQERALLENELDMLRSRAAEMSEAAAQQQRQLAEERNQWSQELKRMRRLLETLCSRQQEASLAAPPRPMPADSDQEPRRGPGAAAQARPGADPVLGSVMAQFEMLQRDLLRRRKENAEASSAVNC